MIQFKVKIDLHCGQLTFQVLFYIQPVDVFSLHFISIKLANINLGLSSLAIHSLSNIVHIIFSKVQSDFSLNNTFVSLSVQIYYTNCNMER